MHGRLHRYPHKIVRAIALQLDIFSAFSRALSLQFRTAPGTRSRFKAQDLFYIRNWSIWLDIYILLQTVIVVLNGRGAK
jgi:lipopolysaccharide/colanic/teichoic acid biosynthesis glycosyltransferase